MGLFEGSSSRQKGLAMLRLRLVVLLVVLGSSPKAFSIDFQRGDCNQDGQVNIADPIFLLNYMFQQAAEPGCLDSCDVNDDGVVDIADPIFSLSFFKGGGPLPPPPFNVCGSDPSADDLDCLGFAACP